MRALTSLALSCTVVGALAAASPQAPAPHEPTDTTSQVQASDGPDAVDIVIRDFAFSPPVVHVARGGTVTWTHDDAPSHNITARDRSFSTTLGNGETFRIDVGDEDRFIEYFCGIHASMSGRIVVGDGPPPSELAVVRVPEDDPDLAHAVLLASADTVIDIAPGDYLVNEPLTPTAAGVTLRGRGDEPGAVRITPGLSTVTPAIRVEVPGVTVENVRLVSFRETTVDLGPTDGVTLRDVEIVARDGGRRDGRQADVGVHVRGTNGVGLTRVVIEEATRAGILVDPCETCAVAMRDVVLRDNDMGAALGDGASLVARDLRISGGTVGLRVEARSRPASLQLADVDIRSRQVGVWLTGVRSSVIERVTLVGHDRFGLAIEGAPATDVTVRDVEADGNTVDVGWDGLGSATCFDLDGTTTEPVTLATTASCTSPAPASVYWPVVTARLVSP